MVSRTEQGWTDLINGLGILRYGAYTDTSPTNCENDVLRVMSNPDKFSDDELVSLERMGFISDGDTFYSRRFGSA